MTLHLEERIGGQLGSQARIRVDPAQVEEDGRRDLSLTEEEISGSS